MNDKMTIKDILLSIAIPVVQMGAVCKFAAWMGKRDEGQKKAR